MDFYYKKYRDILYVRQIINYEVTISIYLYVNQ